LESRYHYRYLPSSTNTATSRINSPDGRSPAPENRQPEQQQQQQQPSSSPILVNELTLPSTHGNMSMIEQEHSSTGSSETSDSHSAIMMDVGLQVES
jgi:hypothetical protein